PGTYYFLLNSSWINSYYNSSIRIDDMAVAMPETTLGRVHPSASPYYRLVLAEDTVVAWDLISGSGVKVEVKGEFGGYTQNVITSGLFLYPAGNYYVSFTGVVQSSDLTHGRVVELDEDLNFSSTQKIAWMKLVITANTYLSWKKSDNGSGITGVIYSHSNLTSSLTTNGAGVYVVTPGDYYIKQSYETFVSFDTLILEELNPLAYTYGTPIEVEKETYYGVIIPTWDDLFQYREYQHLFIDQSKFEINREHTICALFIPGQMVLLIHFWWGMLQLVLRRLRQGIRFLL
ncbi:MAG: hypothetical protein EZS28_051300, partial [Streblomastix strix]